MRDRISPEGYRVTADERSSTRDAESAREIAERRGQDTGENTDTAPDATHDRDTNDGDPLDKGAYDPTDDWE